MIKILFIIVIIQILYTDIIAQNDFLSRVSAIKVMSSTRRDVEKIFGKPGKNLNVNLNDKAFSDWYINDREALEFVYSDGKCGLGWRAPQDVVIRISLDFKDHEKKLSELKNRLKREKKLKLDNLRMEKAMCLIGERSYYDDIFGIHYGVDEKRKIWFSIMFYPSLEYSQFKCE